MLPGLLALSPLFFAPAAFGCNPQVEEAYGEILKLRLERGRELIQREVRLHPAKPCSLLVQNYDDFFSLMLSQNPAQFEETDAAQEKRLDHLQTLQDQRTYRLHAQGKVKLHLALAAL